MTDVFFIGVLTMTEAVSVFYIGLKDMGISLLKSIFGAGGWKATTTKWGEQNGKTPLRLYRQFADYWVS